MSGRAEDTYYRWDGAAERCRQGNPSDTDSDHPLGHSSEAPTHKQTPVILDRSY